MKTNGLIECNILDDSQTANVVAVAKALALPLRVEIIRQLFEKAMSITEIAKINRISNSTAIFHLRLLQEAGLITVEYAPSKKGMAQICYNDFLNVNFHLSEIKHDTTNFYTQSLPVGLYVAAQFDDYVRFATDSEIVRIGLHDIFNNKRQQAQLLWSKGGWVTYAFSNEFAQNAEVSELSVSLEICSEVAYYRDDWKSDIDFFINGIKLLTYTSPGDFGGRRGLLNPDWWQDNSTQYGLLKTISVTEKGVFLDNTIVNSDIALSDLNISDGNQILFTVRCDKTAEHYGGFNIFGKKFGNYPQDIVLTAAYKPIVK